jgi:hypoxanthine phosphoribosyltransferase
VIGRISAASAVATDAAPIHVLSWAEIDGIVELLADKVSHLSFEAIVGISRSGLVPAVMLSHTIKVRALSVINIVRTVSDDINSAKRDPVCHGISNPEWLAGRKVLLVDDIVGKAQTVGLATRALRDVGASPLSATLVVNKANLGDAAPESVVDFHGCVVNGWVVFPWEGKRVASRA